MHKSDEFSVSTPLAIEIFAILCLKPPKWLLHILGAPFFDTFVTELVSTTVLLLIFIYSDLNTKYGVPGYHLKFFPINSSQQKAKSARS